MPDDLDTTASTDATEPSGELAPEKDMTRARAAQGGRWGIFSAMCEQAGSMIATVVLARLLDPEAFGVVAAATILLNLLHIFGNVGFGASLVKRKNIDEPIASTTFWAATGIGAALTTILIIFAPLLARAIGQPDVTPYVRALAPLLLITMVSNVSEAQLLRALRFPWVYTADIANIVVYVGLTLALAWAGTGAWSMVIGRVVGELVASTVRLLAARWRPRFVFHWGTIREDLRFNGGFFGMQVLAFLTKNVDYWVVSSSLGAVALGVYYVAFVLPSILRQRMTWLAGEILFPIMARARDDLDRLKSLYEDSVEFLNFVALPILAGVALTAKQVILIAFGSKWTDAIGPTRWLTVAALFELSTQGAGTLFMSVGKPGIMNRVIGVRLALTATAVIIAVHVSDSITWVAGAVAISVALSTLPLHRAVGIELGISPFSVLRWLRPSLLALAAMTVTVTAGQLALESVGLVIQAVVLATVGAATYAGVVLAVDRRWSLRMFGMVRQVLRRG